ncbi:hypothetical protein P5673_002364 [Acropora cervicornis]|uniref:Uncharacterized protein n=1 Tax=Acropora cervicornis TaxID=6130 RepID=A0AAD9R3J0_ACRCE|nr:hypothetical protein P5673_002364 [Acropora cervicornis]
MNISTCSLQRDETVEECKGNVNGCDSKVGALSRLWEKITGVKFGTVAHYVDGAIFKKPFILDIELRRPESAVKLPNEFADSIKKYCSNRIDISRDLAIGRLRCLEAHTDILFILTDTKNISENSMLSYENVRDASLLCQEQKCASKL